MFPPKSVGGAILTSWHTEYDFIRGLSRIKLGINLVEYDVRGESNGKLPLRTCAGCNIPETY